ncbi:hypothetical protein [Vibrio superstes]|uniref:Uncharacterized protein n=1 Tax=Vibrio superstes NBRC 103154 TaxID=1219062 RepID=A0A511QVE2_9VIBR|nr:hypothetical protein [Vibrio superstes]GEM81349.1 hypothetical protein VSU01S_35940 [Vibrio superstes NBRC 103154]
MQRVRLEAQIKARQKSLDFLVGERLEHLKRKPNVDAHYDPIYGEDGLLRQWRRELAKIANKVHKAEKLRDRAKYELTQFDAPPPPKKNRKAWPSQEVRSSYTDSGCNAFLGRVCRCHL